MTVVDLSDDRRSKKPWLPEDDRDVTDEFGKPSCRFHEWDHP